MTQTEGFGHKFLAILMLGFVFALLMAAAWIGLYSVHEYLALGVMGFLFCLYIFMAIGIIASKKPLT